MTLFLYIYIVIVESNQSHVISELKEQQQNETTSTLLLIDAESCSFKYPDECPDLLLTVVRLLRHGLIHNVVPIGDLLHNPLYKYSIDSFLLFSVLNT